MKLWLKTALALLAVWAVAGGVIWYLHASKPTAQSVTDYLAHASIETKTGTERDRTIRRLEDQLNGVTFEERQQLQRSGVTRHFFMALTPAEQTAFLNATLPADFKQIMEAFNKMDPAKRKELVAHAVTEMQKHAGDGPAPGLNPQLNDQIVTQGMRSFYSDASADTKLDMAPLIEQMQHNLQLGGGGG